MIVGIDSMILIYAGLVPSKASKSGGLGDLVFRAQILLHDLRKDTIVLPTVAIAELLVPVPATQRGLLVASLAERFVCPTFDQQAASIAADLWSRHKKLSPNVQYESRHILRADAMIVASAKAAGATDFYTNDSSCRALADLIMKGRGLPTHSENLFIKEELAENEED